jgi:hypothetical protein
MDSAPIRVTRLNMLDGYTTDQMLILPKGAAGRTAGPGAPLDDPAQLKSAVEDAIQSFGSNALNTNASRADLNRYAQLIRNDWKATVRAGTPGMDRAAAAARASYETDHNPMAKSVTGRVAGVQGASETKEAVDKLTAVFNRGSPRAGYSEILTLEQDLRAKNPGLFADAVATNLADRITKLLPTTGARVDEDNFAANLKKALAGNPAQERGLREMLAGAARSKGMSEEQEKRVVNGFMQLVRMATAVEKRPPRVSGLPIPDLMEEAGRSKLATTVQMQSNYQLGKKIREAFSGDAYRTMDRLLNDPDGLQTLIALSKQSIMSPSARAAVGGFFGATGQNEPN